MPAGRALSSARILAIARHRIATVFVRDHLLIRVCQGTKTLVSNGEEHVFGMGAVIVLRRGSEWDVINDPGPSRQYEARVIRFGDDIVREFHQRYPRLQEEDVEPRLFGQQHDPELASVVDRGVDALNGTHISQELARHRILEVLLLLADRGFALEATDALNWADRLRRLVASRPHADWSVDRLSSAFHMSASSLRRRLREEGTLAAEIVRETRLETGLDLLQTTTLDVGTIAQHCGYSSHSRFTAAFRARFGFTPSDLRPRRTASRATDIA